MTPPTYDRFLYQRIVRDLAVPGAARHMFANLSPVDTREEMLFREVVARRVYDAVGITGESQKRTYAHDNMVRNARTWLRFGDDRDVLMELGDVPVGPWISEVLAVPPNFLHSSTVNETPDWWVTATSQSILIRDMTDSHLTNTIEWLRRTAPDRLKAAISRMMESDGFVMGDVAVDSFYMEFDTLVDSDPLDYMEDTEPRYVVMLRLADERGLPVKKYLDDTVWAHYERDHELGEEIPF